MELKFLGQNLLLEMLRDFDDCSIPDLKTLLKGILYYTAQ